MNSVYDFFAGEERYPCLDAEGAVRRLSEAVRCRTVNNPCINDFEEFEKL